MEDALAEVCHLPYEDLGFACLDTHRMLRKGFPEVVLCEWKTARQVIEILTRLCKHHGRAFATRATQKMYRHVRKAIPDARYHTDARVITVGDDPPLSTDQLVVVVSAGTSDIPVAEEAAISARWAGCPVERLYDVGVAGLHRTLAHLDLLQRARVVIAVAGMEGALPGVLAGLLCVPVVAVPTRIGYGAHFEGVASLLTMLNSCAPGIAVVNIDNGFGAGLFASLIAREPPSPRARTTERGRTRSNGRRPKVSATSVRHRKK